MENPFYIPGDLTGTKVVPLEETPKETLLPAEEPAEVPPAEPQKEFTAEDLL